MGLISKGCVNEEWSQYCLLERLQLYRVNEADKAKEIRIQYTMYARELRALFQQASINTKVSPDLAAVRVGLVNWLL